MTRHSCFYNCLPSSAFRLPSVRRPSSGVRRPSGAFTLVELLVVIVVLSILAGITIPVSRYAIDRAKKARQKVMLERIRAALDDYRSVYGEYPITPLTNTSGDVINHAEAAKHYWDNVNTEIGEQTNILEYTPFTNVDLSLGTVEKLSYQQKFAGEQATEIDYSLTFPLMIRPMRENKRPFYEFSRVPAMFLVHKKVAPQDIISFVFRRRGGVKKTLQAIKGKSLDRYKAVDPISGMQWKYECSDGINYSITTNKF